MVVDRVKAETLNVAVGEVFNVLAGYVGSSYVNQFNKFGRTFQVYVQADSKYRLLPGDIENLYVRSQDNKMVPLGTLVQLREVGGPIIVTRYNLYTAASVSGGIQTGYSTGDAIQATQCTGLSSQQNCAGGVNADYADSGYVYSITVNRAQHVGQSLIAAQSIDTR